MDRETVEEIKRATLRSEVAHEFDETRLENRLAS
jgi:hypothetical protein